MKWVYILSLVLMLGCTSNSISLKEKSNAAKIEVVSKVAYQQSIALNKTNVPLAVQYNGNIISLVGSPKDTKTTNFTADIQRVKQSEYIANATLEDDLIKSKNELREYKKWFGLHGVYLGLKQFSKWVIGSTLALTVLYILLRVFANSSPILLAIWNVINSFFAYFINLLAKMMPGLMDKIGEETLTVRNYLKRIFSKK